MKEQPSSHLVILSSPLGPKHVWSLSSAGLMIVLLNSRAGEHDAVRPRKREGAHHEDQMNDDLPHDALAADMEARDAHFNLKEPSLRA